MVPYALGRAVQSYVAIAGRVDRRMVQLQVAV